MRTCVRLFWLLTRSPEKVSEYDQEILKSLWPMFNYVLSVALRQTKLNSKETVYKGSKMSKYVLLN